MAPFLLALATAVCVAASEAASPLSYGHYRLSVTNYTQCVGAKRRSAVEVNATWTKNPDGTDHAVMLALVKRSVGPISSRTKVYKYENGVPKLTIEYRVENICNHFMGKLAIKYMPPTDRRCYLLKSFIRYELPDLNELAHMNFGQQFFRGQFLFHIDYSSAKDEIVCFKIFLDILPIA